MHAQMLKWMTTVVWVTIMNGRFDQLQLTPPKVRCSVLKTFPSSKGRGLFTLWLKSSEGFKKGIKYDKIDQELKYSSN